MSAAMKDSGVDWIGEIPQEWETRRLRFVGTMTKGLPIQKTDLVDKGVAVISYGQIHSKDNHSSSLQEELKRYVPRELAPVHSKSKLRLDDLVFADTSEDVEGVGNVVRIGDNAEVYAGYHTVAFRPRRDMVSGHYLYYLAQSDIWRAQLRKLVMGVKVYSITQGILSRAEVILPPRNEQLEIATYLDRATEALDSEIRSIVKQIDVLERYRKSVIHEAVTKGLNPDALMKDSGVEWIGEIPTHWTAKRLKYVCDTNSGTTPDSNNYDYYDGEVSWIQSGDLYGTNTIASTDKSVTHKALIEHSALSVYKAPFVVIAMYGASIGNSALSQIDACLNQACCALIPNNQIDVHYLAYAIQDAKKDLRTRGMGGTQPNISQIIIKNENLPLPDMREQLGIVKYLDEKTAKIDAILDIKRKQLEILKKRRQSLIYEYVTGKRRVEG